MKILISILLFLTSILGFSQSSMFDYYYKSENYCVINLPDYKVSTVDGFTFYDTNLNGMRVLLCIHPINKLVTNIIIPYGDNKKLRKEILKYIKKSGNKSGKQWYFLFEESEYKIYVHEDKNVKSFIFE
jgi:hypothetical protein